MRRLASPAARQHWRRVLLSTDFAVLVIVIATVLVLFGPAQAPIDGISYAMSYADGQVRDDRWTEQQAQQMVQATLAAWLPAVVRPSVALVAGSVALLGCKPGSGGALGESSRRQGIDEEYT